MGCSELPSPAGGCGLRRVGRPHLSARRMGQLATKRTLGSNPTSSASAIGAGARGSDLSGACCEPEIGLN
jgi:hypothetical protein